MQRYYEESGRRVLMLAGEEIHDRTRIPQKDHLLVLGVDRELAALGEDLDSLLMRGEASGRNILPGTSCRPSRTGVP